MKNYFKCSEKTKYNSYDDYICIMFLKLLFFGLNKHNYCLYHLLKASSHLKYQRKTHTAAARKKSFG